MMVPLFSTRSSTRVDVFGLTFCHSSSSPAQQSSLVLASSAYELSIPMIATSLFTMYMAVS